jgi:hypothetical protein
LENALSELLSKDLKVVLGEFDDYSFSKLNRTAVVATLADFEAI